MPKGEEELLMLMPKSNYEFLRGWALMTHEDSGIGLFHSCLMGETVQWGGSAGDSGIRGAAPMLTAAEPHE